jgi:hypothetical protein
VARAIVDPEQVRRFAGHLDQSATAIREQKTAALASFARLHNTWRDEKYARFEQLFTESMILLERYLQQSEQYSRFLKQKAARAQKYLDQR